MKQFLFRTSHRPRPLPSGRWSLVQRWNDLLFAHWPLDPKLLTPALPAELHPDLFNGSAWIGVVPFWMDRLKFRTLPPFPAGNGLPGLNLRTYVRHRQTGVSGIYLLSHETNSMLTAGFGWAFTRLPIHLAEMSFEHRREREFGFYSRRRFTRSQVLFKARYRGLGPTRKLAELRPGSLEAFLLDRSCVFLLDRSGRPAQANIHYINSPLEEAEAEIEQNDLATALGISLPPMDPVLYYSRRMAAYVWPPEPVPSSIAARPVTVPATQS